MEWSESKHTWWHYCARSWDKIIFHSVTDLNKIHLLPCNLFIICKMFHSSFTKSAKNQVKNPKTDITYIVIYARRLYGYGTHECWQLVLRIIFQKLNFINRFWSSNLKWLLYCHKCSITNYSMDEVRMNY